MSLGMGEGNPHCFVPGSLQHPKNSWAHWEAEAERHVMWDAQEMPDRPSLPSCAPTPPGSGPPHPSQGWPHSCQHGTHRQWQEEKETAPGLKAEDQACPAMDTDSKSPSLSGPQLSPRKKGLIVLIAPGNGEAKQKSEVKVI